MANGNVSGLGRQFQLPDFRQTQQFPIAAVIDAIQRKPGLEEQIKSSQQSRALKPLEFALQAAQAGSNLASASLARSQAKTANLERIERKQEISNLASILESSLESRIKPLQEQLRPLQQQLQRPVATPIQQFAPTQGPATQTGVGPAPVPTEQVTPTFAETPQAAPIQAQAAPIQQQVQSLQQKQRLIGSLVRNGKITEALQVADIEGTQTVSARQRSVRNLQLGTKPPKPFIVDSISNKVFDLGGRELPPEEAAQLIAGFAPTANVQGATVSGAPIVFDPRSKTFEVGRVPGGRLLPKLKVAPPSSINLQADVADLDDALKIVEENLDVSFIGPIRGRLGNIAQSLEVTSSAKRARFIAAVNNFRNKTIKAITGAQMSEPEAKRIMKQMPNENMSVTDFKEKLKISSTLLKQSIARKQKKLEAAGFILERAPKPSQINAQNLNPQQRRTRIQELRAKQGR